MIAFVNGIVKIIRNDRVVLDVHGVGYEVYLANALSQKMNEKLFLYTYQHVREDAILLFGFIKEEDYEVFMRLINVKGIGPKTAQTMLSVCSGKEMIEAIENDDIKRLKSLPGIGAKTAGQIVLDLKGKFVSLETSDSPVSNPVWTQVQDALLSLGYKTNQLTKIKKEFENTELGEDEMLRQALILLAKRNGV
ncbi:Holliday junction branch migration protein RuvA [Holdemanella biformis]|uniref:Holliday junction branch migration protein RuvA n=1 Tax=Holdemanella biformis TaxID=1735 RepID=UPI002664EA77|nr:Holliday junction branch migration protein RuvA [Holdemanella biformis]